MISRNLLAASLAALALMSSAHVQARATVTTIKVDASGAQEVPAVDTDVRATATAKVAKNLSSVRITGRARGIGSVDDLTGIHLHCGAAGENGDIAVTLYDQTDIPGSPLRVSNRGVARGTITNDDIDPTNDCETDIGMVVNNIASLYAAVLEGLIYINFHTVSNPSGEVRDQLFVLK